MAEIEAWADVKTIKKANTYLRWLARRISKLKGNAKGEISVFQHDENRSERMTRGEYAKELRRDKAELEERKIEIKQEEKQKKNLDAARKGRALRSKTDPNTGERLDAGRGANRDANIGKGKKPRRKVGGGRAAAAIDSRRGGLAKSLMTRKLMPKT